MGEAPPVASKLSPATLPCMPGDSPMTLPVVQHRFGLWNGASSPSRRQPWPAAPPSRVILRGTGNCIILSASSCLAFQRKTAEAPANSKDDLICELWED